MIAPDPNATVRSKGHAVTIGCRYSAHAGEASHLFRRGGGTIHGDIAPLPDDAVGIERKGVLLGGGDSDEVADAADQARLFSIFGSPGPQGVALHREAEAAARCD